MMKMSLRHRDCWLDYLCIRKDKEWPCAPWKLRTAWLTHHKACSSGGCSSPLLPYSVSDPRAHQRSPHPPSWGPLWGGTGGDSLILPHSLLCISLSSAGQGEEGCFRVCLSLSPGKSPCPSSDPTLKVTIATLRFIRWGFKFILFDSGQAEPNLSWHVFLYCQFHLDLKEGEPVRTEKQLPSQTCTLLFLLTVGEVEQLTGKTWSRDPSLSLWVRWPLPPSPHASLPSLG